MVLDFSGASAAGRLAVEKSAKCLAILKSAPG
jgi:hypothetical protein